MPQQNLPANALSRPRLKRHSKFHPAPSLAKQHKSLAHGLKHRYPPACHQPHQAVRNGLQSPKKSKLQIVSYVDTHQPMAPPRQVEVRPASPANAPPQAQPRLNQGIHPPSDHLKSHDNRPFTLLQDKSETLPPSTLPPSTLPPSTLPPGTPPPDQLNAGRSLTLPSHPLALAKTCSVNRFSPNVQYHVDQSPTPASLPTNKQPLLSHALHEPSTLPPCNQSQHTDNFEPNHSRLIPKYSARVHPADKKESHFPVKKCEDSSTGKKGLDSPKKIPCPRDCSVNSLSKHSSLELARIDIGRENTTQNVQSQSGHENPQRSSHPPPPKQPLAWALSNGLKKTHPHATHTLPTHTLPHATHTLLTHTIPHATHTIPHATHTLPHSKRANSQSRAIRPLPPSRLTRHTIDRLPSQHSSHFQTHDRSQLQDTDQQQHPIQAYINAQQLSETVNSHPPSHEVSPYVHQEHLVSLSDLKQLNPQKYAHTNQLLQAPTACSPIVAGTNLPSNAQPHPIGQLSELDRTHPQVLSQLADLLGQNRHHSPAKTAPHLQDHEARHSASQPNSAPKQPSSRCEPSPPQCESISFNVPSPPTPLHQSSTPQGVKMLHISRRNPSSPAGYTLDNISQTTPLSPETLAHTPRIQASSSSHSAQAHPSLHRLHIQHDFRLASYAQKFTESYTNHHEHLQNFTYLILAHIQSLDYVKIPIRCLGSFHNILPVLSQALTHQQPLSRSLESNIFFCALLSEQSDCQCFFWLRSPIQCRQRLALPPVIAAFVTRSVPIEQCRKKGIFSRIFIIDVQGRMSYFELYRRVEEHMQSCKLITVKCDKTKKRRVGRKINPADRILSLAQQEQSPANAKAVRGDQIQQAIQECIKNQASNSPNKDRATLTPDSPTETRQSSLPDNSLCKGTILSCNSPPQRAYALLDELTPQWSKQQQCSPLVQELMGLGGEVFPDSQRRSINENEEQTHKLSEHEYTHIYTRSRQTAKQPDNAILSHRSNKDQYLVIKDYQFAQSDRSNIGIQGRHNPNKNGQNPSTKNNPSHFIANGQGNSEKSKIGLSRLGGQEPAGSMRNNQHQDIPFLCENNHDESTDNFLESMQKISHVSPEMCSHNSSLRANGLVKSCSAKISERLKTF